MTDLSETIARAERAVEVGKSLRVPPSILSEDLALLLATARRAQAMETVKDSEVVAHIRAAAHERDDIGAWKSQEFRAAIYALLDLASDQSAARARVAELEAERSDVKERAERMRDGNRESAAKHKGTRAQLAQHGADVAQYIIGGFKP